MSRGEQVQGDPSRHRKFEKNKHSKAIRREGKKLLDEAPPRNRYKGWSL